MLVSITPSVYLKSPSLDHGLNDFKFCKFLLGLEAKWNLRSLFYSSLSSRKLLYHDYEILLSLSSFALIESCPGNRLLGSIHSHQLLLHPESKWIYYHRKLACKSWKINHNSSNNSHFYCKIIMFFLNLNYKIFES